MVELSLCYTDEGSDIRCRTARLRKSHNHITMGVNSRYKHHLTKCFTSPRLLTSSLAWLPHSKAMRARSPVLDENGNPENTRSVTVRSVPSGYKHLMVCLRLAIFKRRKPCHTENRGCLAPSREACLYGSDRPEPCESKSQRL